MPKKRKEHTEWVITKGRLSRWQREQRQRRVIIIIGCVIVAIVLALVGYAVYASAFKPFHQTILRVNDKSFDMDYYIKMLRLYGIKGVPESDQHYLAQYVLGAIKNNEIHKQLAPTLGIAVTEEEVDAEIQEQLSPSLSYDDFLKRLEEVGASGKDFRAQISADLLTKKIREYIGERDTPTEMPQALVQGILIEIGAEAEVEGETESEGGGETEIEGSKDPEKVREAIKARLDDGEEFAVLAEEFSQDIASKDDGGDLGWLSRDIMSMYYNEEFADVAFHLQLETLSHPIPESASDDNSRYWLIQVLEREDSRPLEEDQREMLKAQAVSDWFREQRDKFTIEDYLNPDLRAWAIDKALK